MSVNPDELTSAMLAKGFVRTAAGWAKPPKSDLLNNNSRQATELEPDPRNGTVGEVQVQKGLGRPILVRVKSYRKHLLDEDNLCEKYHVDLLRYAGVIPSDAPKTTRIEVCQEKVGPKEPERTVIEVFESPVLT